MSRPSAWSGTGSGAKQNAGTSGRVLSPIETRWECDGRGKASEGGEGAGSSGLGLRLGAGPGAPGSRSPNAPTCSIAGGLAGCSCPIPAGLCSIPALLSTAAAGRSIAVKAQVGPKVEAHYSQGLQLASSSVALQRRSRGANGSTHGICITTTRYGNEGHTHASTLRRDGESHTRTHTHRSDKGHTHTHTPTLEDRRSRVDRPTGRASSGAHAVVTK